MSVAKAEGSAGIHEELVDITNCCVCLETYTDPRVLPCIHTFCRKCLESIVARSGKRCGETLPCPSCRREFVIPLAGVSGLEKNFMMVRIMEMSKSASVQSHAFCDSCSEDSATEAPPAEMFCQDCSLKLCEGCCKHHKKLKLTTDHRLVALHEQGDAVPKTSSEFCEQHEKERLKFYCSDCASAVCAFCFIQSHQNHKWKDLQTAAKEFRQEIQNSLKNISRNDSGLNTKRLELEQSKIDVVRNVQLVEKAIIERKEFVKNLVDKHCDLLLARLEDRRKEKLKEIILKDEAFEQQMSNQSHYSVYCEEVTGKGSDVVVCRAQPDIKRRGKELQKLSTKMYKEKLPMTNFTLSANPFEDFLQQSERNLLGSIEDEKDFCPVSGNQIPTTPENPKSPAAKSTEKQAKGKQGKSKLSNADKKSSTSQKPGPSPKWSAPIPQPFKPGVSFAFDSNPGVRYNVVVEIVLSKRERITGMAAVDDEMFIVTELSPSVEVYALSPFNSKGKFTVPGLVKPEDMVGSQVTKRLFIFDANGEGKILHVDRNSEQVLHQCLTGSAAMRLSITPDDYVLATYVGKNKLKEYCFSNAVKLISNTVLTSNGSSFAVKRIGGTYLVSRGQHADAKVACGVYEVDASSKVESNSFTGQQGSHFGTLVDPDQLVIDKCGWVVVADRGTKRILLLNSELRFERVLLTEHHGLHDPQRIVFDESTSRLLVADFDRMQNVARIYSVQGIVA